MKRGGMCEKPSSRDPHKGSASELLRTERTSGWGECPEQPMRPMLCEMQINNPRKALAGMPMGRELVNLMKCRNPNHSPPPMFLLTSMSSVIVRHPIPSHFGFKHQHSQCSPDESYEPQSPLAEGRPPHRRGGIKLEAVVTHITLRIDRGA